MLLAAAERLGRVGLAPRRVVALPEPYMASHQPEGPWPDGPTPQDALDAAARAFPDAAVGAGMLTYFTELNRCRPPAGRGAHVAHGLAAIVHAADDASVLQTLQALPAVFATGREIAGDRPLRLGLCAIGLRTNPYGADVAPNPRGERVPMASEDPRQARPLAAAHAVGLAVRAAEAGVEAMALAGRGGPFGTSGPAGPHPIHAALEALARLGPGPLRAPEGLPDGVLGLAGPRGAILVNATLEPATLRLARAGRAWPLEAAVPDRPSRTVQLAPCGVVLLEVEP